MSKQNNKEIVEDKIEIEEIIDLKIPNNKIETEEGKKERQKKNKEDLNFLLDDIEMKEENYVNKETDSRKALVESYALALHIARYYLDNDKELIKKISKRLFNAFKIIITEGFKLSTNSVAYNQLQNRLEAIKDTFLKLSLRDEKKILTNENYSKFFEETGKQFQKIIVDEIFGLCHDLMLYSLKDHGEQYAILGIGSLATKRLTPYSDLEFIIIIDGKMPTDDSSELREKLYQFSELAELLITALGETPIHIAELALKLCLGKQYEEYSKSFKGTQGLRVDEHKRANERNLVVDLTNTTKTILQMFNPDKELNILHKTGNHITAALLTTTLLAGNEKLYKDYDQKLIEALQMKKWRVFISGMTGSNLSSFKEKVLKIEKGKIEEINIKKDLLECLMHIPMELALLGIGRKLFKFKNNAVPKTLEEALGLLLTDQRVVKAIGEKMAKDNDWKKLLQGKELKMTGLKNVIEDWNLLVKELMILRVNIQSKNQSSYAGISYKILLEEIPHLPERLKNIANTITELKELIETLEPSKLSNNISNVYSNNQINNNDNIIIDEETNEEHIFN
jgi:hypothetical protein